MSDEKKEADPSVARTVHIDFDTGATEVLDHVLNSTAAHLMGEAWMEAAATGSSLIRSSHIRTAASNQGLGNYLPS